MQDEKGKPVVLCDVLQVTKQKTLGIPNALEIRVRGHGEGAGLKLYAPCMFARAMHFTITHAMHFTITRRNA